MLSIYNIKAITVPTLTPVLKPQHLQSAMQMKNLKQLATSFFANKRYVNNEYLVACFTRQEKPSYGIDFKAINPTNCEFYLFYSIPF